MNLFDRRQALHLGLGASATLCLGRAGRGAPARTIDELAGRLRAAAPDGALGAAARALRDGADWRALLEAAFVAGVHEIRPTPVGSELHALMMVESAWQLALISTPEQRQLAALFNVWDFERAHRRERAAGDWVLPSAPAASHASADAARRELLAALEAWEVERAERAVVGLLRHTDLAEVFETLWPAAMRSFVDLGHKLIHAVQMRRALERIDGRHAAPALRALVRSLLHVDGGRQIEAFSSSGERAVRLERWTPRTEDPAASAELCAALRDATIDAAQAAVLAACTSGLGPRTIWDGLRLQACELFHRRPAAAARRHQAVHSVTEVNAFGWIARNAARVETRNLALLQAAAWLVQLREAMVARFGPQRDESLLRLGADEERAGLDAAFAQSSPSVARAALERGARGFEARIRALLFSKGWQDHQYKFCAAVHEESALAHPTWRAYLSAPCLTYLPSTADPAGEVHARSLAALREVGLR